MILVDAAVWRQHSGGSTRFAHLASDVSYSELHEFARALGIPRRRFQGDHYDIPSSLRIHAIRMGATPVRSVEIVRRLRAAGLRHRGHRLQPQAPNASVV